MGVRQLTSWFSEAANKSFASEKEAQFEELRYKLSVWNRKSHDFVISASEVNAVLAMVHPYARVAWQGTLKYDGKFDG